ncbi:centromere protein T [Gracilinanus agilis]|uniref:centromere protein T n=1 Tax=Gracilinanus agilis TaxID=191870 RepID=UPI001CFF0D6E|nr:centromere protein T [Gracilinanus agilis]
MAGPRAPQFPWPHVLLQGPNMDWPYGAPSHPTPQTAPIQPKDIGAHDQKFVEHYDLLEEGTPRILLKKILQTASEASVLVPVLMNSQEPEPVKLQEESKWNSLELQLPEPEPSVSLAPELLVHSRRKRCLRVSEFEQEVDQGLAVSSGERASANKSSMTRSFNLTLATVMPPESVERPGLARRPQTRKKVDMEAFEHRLKDIPLTLLPDRHSNHSTMPVDGARSFQSSPYSLGFRRSLTKDQQLRATTHRANQRKKKGIGILGGAGSRRAIKSWPKSPLQNYPLSETNSRSTKRQARPWTGRPSQSSYLSAYSVLATSNISREAVAKSDVAYQIEEEGERLMVDQAEESEEDIETPQRAAVSELSMKTPEFLQAKRQRSFSQPASLAPPNTNTVLLPSKVTQAKHAPKRCATGPRQPHDPDKAGLDHYCKVFSYYAKMPMEKSASKTLVKCLDQYFRTLCDDLETFAHHAGRKTVLLDDLELLMRRQGLVTDEVSLYVLVERHLPLEYRRLLIPCAASGNSVFPAG